jgi:uncharacterized repeat protein (TIGR01451 family)
MTDNSSQSNGCRCARTLRAGLFDVLTCAWALGLLAAPGGQAAQTNPVSARMELPEYGVSVPVPPGWSEHHTANLHELLNIPLDKLSTLQPADREDLPRINVMVISGDDHAEALHRLQQIAAEWNLPVTFLSVGNWPALQRRILVPKPVEADDVSQADKPEMLVMVTTAIAAGNLLVRLDGVAPEEAPAHIVDQMLSAGRAVTFRGTGDAAQTNQEVEELRHTAPLKSPPPSTSPNTVPESQSIIQNAPAMREAGASFVNLQIGDEPEIAVSTDGKNIVVAAQCGFSNSTDGGLTFPTRGTMPKCTGGDSSVAFGKSGNFYEATISSTSACPPANPRCNNATAINLSTNKGQTFNFLTDAFVCGTCGFGGVPDQEHIAADRFNSSSSNQDRVYSAWRKGFGYGLVCSSDSGANWSTPTFVNPGSTDFPRITVGQDSTVYVVTQNGGNIVLDSYSSCDSGLKPIVKQSVIATGVNYVTCPVPGLDRCNNGNNLSSWTVGVDDTNAAHVYVSYSVNTSSGVNENVLVQDSIDSGKTWTRPSVQINTSINGRRFMPWMCAVGGIAFVSWYDRRNVTSTANDLTDYFAGSAFLSGGNLTAGNEFQVNSTGTSDPQCAAGQVPGSAGSWPCGTRAVADASSCSFQPQLAGRCFTSGGVCSASPKGSGQPCNLASPTCSTPGETCMRGSGSPKYGDYNGSACGAGRVFNIFLSGTPQPGATAPISTNLFFSQTCATSACPDDLAITKTAASIVVAGTNLTYTIGVRNKGPANATNVVVTDRLPNGVTFVNSTASCTNSAGTLTCNLGNLSASSNVSFSVTIHVPSGGVGSSTITNMANAASTQTDLNPGDNTTSLSTTVIAQADLAITKTSAPNPVAAGTSLTYTIKVSNAGPSDAPSVVVKDTLPLGVTFQHSSPVGCVGTTTLTCNVGTLVSGANAIFALVVKIPADYLSSRSLITATITNTSTVASSVTDPNLINNKAAVNTKVIAVADMDLTMTATPNPIKEGNILTYNMSFINTGPSDAILGTIRDYFPQGLIFIGSDTVPCGAGTINVFLCQLGPVVPAGFGYTFHVQMRIPNNFLPNNVTSTNVVNNALISSSTTDPDAGDGPAMVATTVTH